MPKKKETISKDIKMERGEANCQMIEPIVNIVGTGGLTYLWVGNKNEGGCFGTLQGAKLKKLAEEILKAINNPH